jgi:hypothetical protein
MTTRTIVTSQPDVACHVCERRLLRGEQPEVFLAAGRPRTVCELCAPRAAHQGWKRESDPHPISAAPLRAGRGRNLFERLRQVGRPALASSGELVAQDAYEQEPEPYDFLGGADPKAGESSRAALAGDGADAREPRAERGGTLAGTRAGGPLQSAIDVFNAGEYPRRVASLTRSLGAPEVSVRPGEAVASAVSILIAWELCWYRYEVDLDDLRGVETRAIAQGTELSELRQEERLANALADERGALSLADVHAP